MVAIALLAGATPVLACDDPQTQSAMTACAAKDYATADAAMAGQWKTVYARMKRLDAQDTSRGGGFGYAAALLASQRAWLKYRDTHCVISAAEFAGGSLQPMVAAQCRTRLTDLRTSDLKALTWQR
jgi:uncharacterized protein YecT (DUF1311 family)